MEASRIADALARAGQPGPPRLEVLAGEGGSAERVGILPGSFDPITRAHVVLAEALRRRDAEPVLFLYSARTLPKEAPAPASLLPPEHRLAAVAAVCERRAGLGIAVCSHGLLADQARATSVSFPPARPVVGIGSDKLRQLFDPRWYEDRDTALERLFAVAEVAVAARAGDEAVVDAVLSANPRWAGRVDRIDLPDDVAAVSSSVVRDRVRRGRDVADLVPPEALPFLDDGLG